MRKPFAQAAKGDEEIKISCHTCTHLRGPPVLSYGHFGSNLKLDQPAVFGSAHSTDGPKRDQINNSGTNALPRFLGRIAGHRNQNEITSAGGSGKCLDLIT
jgi:hypothetical protein